MIYIYIYDLSLSISLSLYIYIERERAYNTIDLEQLLLIASMYGFCYHFNNLRFRTTAQHITN